MSNLKDPTEARKLLAEVPMPPACSCSICQDMCKRSCWPTPEEAEVLMDAGLGSYLMLDYWVGEMGNDTYVLCPATQGCEADRAPFWPVGRCTFQVDGLCYLHDDGLKPLEGKLASCSDMPSIHSLVAALWQTDEAKALVKRWEKEHLLSV